jgi:hypothetical protein
MEDHSTPKEVTLPKNNRNNRIKVAKANKFLVMGRFVSFAQGLKWSKA